MSTIPSIFIVFIVYIVVYIVLQVLAKLKNNGLKHYINHFLERVKHSELDIYIQDLNLTHVVKIILLPIWVVLFLVLALSVINTVFGFGDPKWSYLILLIMLLIIPLTLYNNYHAGIKLTINIICLIVFSLLSPDYSYQSDFVISFFWLKAFCIVLFFVTSVHAAAIFFKTSQKNNTANESNRIAPIVTTKADNDSNLNDKLLTECSKGQQGESSLDYEGDRHFIEKLENCNDYKYGAHISEKVKNTIRKKTWVVTKITKHPWVIDISDNYYFPVIKNLINLGVNINVADNFGLTALLWAVKRNNPALVYYLVENGANLNCTTISGCVYQNYFFDPYDSPIRIAINTDTGIFRYLVDKGAIFM